MTEIHYRHASFKRAAINKETREVELSFSSEFPYDDGTGIEILDHSEKSVQFGRLNDGASLLNEHDRKSVIGCVVRAWVKDKKGRAIVRFGTSPLAREIWEDVVAGIRSLVSVSYRGYQYVAEELSPGVHAARCVLWEALELSMVSIPADPTVGIGRSLETPTKPTRKMISTDNETETETAPPLERLRAQQRKNEEEIFALSASLKKDHEGFEDITLKALSDRWDVEKYRTAVYARLQEQTEACFAPGRQIRNPVWPPVSQTGERGFGLTIAQSPELKRFLDRKHTPGRKLEMRFDGDWRQRATATTSTITNFSGITHAPGPIEIGVQTPTVADLFTQQTTDLAEVPYLQEDTLTNAATAVAEGALKPEASWDWSQAKATVKKIAVTAKASDELLADVPGVQNYLDGRMRLMVNMVEDQQLITGDGIGANLLGLLGTSGIQTQAKGADTTLDAIRKGISLIQTNAFLEPDGIIMNPLDWLEISLLKDANNQYYAGGPFFAPYGNGGFIAFQRLWGLKVVITTSMTQNTCIVGAFREASTIYRRQGLTLEMRDTNEDDWRKNLVAIRCETRLALAVFRPKGICSVTGI